jgi:hypothetical protein
MRTPKQSTKCATASSRVRRALDDLGAITSELAATRGRSEARPIVTGLLSVGST